MRSSQAISWMFAGAVILFVSIGMWAVRLQAQEARDTIRKHDLEDLEQALFRYSRQTGTYPPDDLPVWCGTLSAPGHRDVRTSIENVLRHDEKYEKQEKPFPEDPLFGGTNEDYLYWKTSPTSFELLAALEADDNNTRVIDRKRCLALRPEEIVQAIPTEEGVGKYDYSIVSTNRLSF